MKKLLVAIAAAMAVAVTVGSDDAWSQGHRGGGHGGSHYSGYGGRHYGGHSGGYYGGRHGGYYGARYGGYYGARYGGYYGGYYGWGAYLGSALYWGWPSYGYGYAGYPYFPSYSYRQFPVYHSAPLVYVEPAQFPNQSGEAPPAPQNLWFYCTDPAGYYPYVQNCTVPWVKVVPPPSPSGEPAN